jgi:hypothetical protein
MIKKILFFFTLSIHLNGFSEDEKDSYREIIYGNVLRAMKALVQATFQFNIPIEKEENREKAGRINELENEVFLQVSKFWTTELAEDVEDLWSDPGIQKVFEKRNEFQLDDSAPYYFNHMDRIKQSDYKPNVEDVLRSRVKTTGIVEMNFKLNDQSVTLIDVGGQRNGK